MRRVGVLALALVGHPACSGDGGGEGGPTWTVIRIIDHDPPNVIASIPGADIDRLELDDSSGAVLAAGCVSAALDPATVPYPATDPSHNGISQGTLGILEGSPDTGYLSLGGSTLWCDAGVAMHDGDHILVWELHTVDIGDADMFSVDVCETMSGPCLPVPLATDVVISGGVDSYADVVVSGI